MQKPVRASVVAALSFAFTYFFFFEYLPPFSRVHIPYDLEGYFYPLADYAFQQLREARFPQWDPAIYCGTTFAGNIQAALFYPPTWLAFAVNGGRHALLYQWVEILVLAHVWLGFLLCFVWLRRKGLADLSSALGAGIFAFSGYLAQHLQHFGVAAGYAWMPLGFWGIDEAVEQRRWRPLWKVSAASALCLLAGYVPLWFVFATCMVVYAAWRLRALAGVLAAIAASLAIAAVQLLPAWEAVSLKLPELNYGSGIRDPHYFLYYLLPSYPDWAMSATGRREDQYLYLGPAALLGFLWLAPARDRRAWPMMLVAGVALVFATNPFGLVWAVIRHSALLAQVCRDWYFLAGFNLAAAALAALGLDHALKRKRAPARPWTALAVVGLLAAWSARQLFLWAHGRLATGWWSGLELAVTLALCSLALYLLPGQQRAPRALLAAALLWTVGVDYKVFGTSRRFNASEGQASWTGRDEPLPAMDESVYRRLRDHAEYRIGLDLFGPFPAELRHFGLSSPQGFDPFLTRQYQELMEGIAHFRTNREIDLDPSNTEALRLLGIRYFITADGAPMYSRLSANPEFRLVQPSTGYYKVFEYLNARPPYGWESDNGGSARLLLRTPETRTFLVRSKTGGRFALAEQFFPGWQATVDGIAAPIERWRGTFQAVQVAAGEHRVEFRYRSRALVLGAWISLAAILLIWVGFSLGPKRNALRR